MTRRRSRLLFAVMRREIAAIIIEPLPANYGLLPQRPEFLQAVARLARAHGALLIFDEVISGFRLSFQGYAGLSGIQSRPDDLRQGHRRRLSGRRLWRSPRADGTGGACRAGLPGRHPERQSAGDVRRAGNLAAPGGWQRLPAARAAWRPAASARSAACRVSPSSASARCSGSAVPRPSYPATPIRTLHGFPADAGPSFAALFHPLLERGIYLAPSAYEVGFLSAAHTEAHVDTLAQELRALLPSIDRR